MNNLYELSEMFRKLDIIRLEHPEGSKISKACERARDFVSVAYGELKKQNNVDINNLKNIQ